MKDATASMNIVDNCRSERYDCHQLPLELPGDPIAGGRD